MAKSRSIGGIFAELSLKDLKFRRGLKMAEKKLNAFVSSTIKTGARLAALGGAAIGAGIVAGVTKAVGAAAEMETLKTAFEPLLGSADAAEKRIAELADFAAKTPFELPEIAKASQVLETLTRGALATGEGLTLVGDIAAATNRPFDEVAISVGRLYDGLQSGRPVGEAMMRLQELGAISGDTRAEIERLQKAGAAGDVIWKKAEAALMRFSGSMEKQSATWNGKLSTLRDNINMAFAAMGQPIMDSLKPMLDELANKDFSQLGKNLGDAIAEGLQLLTDGRVWEVFMLYAEKAKLAMQDSTFLSAWASGINATIEAAPFTDAWNEAFDKYAEAGINENKELASDLDRRISEILTKNRQKVAAKLNPLDVPDWMAYLPKTSPMPAGWDLPTAPAAMEKEKKKKKETFDWEASNYSVNEMQARGLGNGAMMIGKENEKQTTLLASIRDILKRMSDAGKEGTLVWN